MASLEHLELSAFIKSIHSNLRKTSDQLGAEEAWKNHCEEEDTLNKYAAAMEKLATQHWEESYKDGSKAVSRIKWVYEMCELYFRGGECLRQRQREIDIAKKINLDLCIDMPNVQDVLKLLDVGSCYNPFKQFNCFDVLAVDIAPANKDVMKCDFLKLDISSIDVSNIIKTSISESLEPNKPKTFETDDSKTFATCKSLGTSKSYIDDNTITSLPSNSFDIIVFSLLLEYLPCPEQRLVCCKKAYDLLKFEGILIIITPDSKHVGANAKIMKSWRYVLSKIGFSRIKYEKLPYIHCIVFRKSLDIKIAQRWATIYENKDFYDTIVIPQDFNNQKDKDTDCEDEEKKCNVGKNFKNETGVWKSEVLCKDNELQSKEQIVYQGACNDLLEQYDVD